VSIKINVREITNVLLADSWYGVADGSFEVVAIAFEFEDPRYQRRESLIRAVFSDPDKKEEISNPGFSFKQEDGSFIEGPISLSTATEN
jgi:hypothetical protein